MKWPLVIVEDSVQCNGQYSHTIAIAKNGAKMVLESQESWAQDARPLSSFYFGALTISSHLLTFLRRTRACMKEPPSNFGPARVSKGPSEVSGSWPLALPACPGQPPVTSRVRERTAPPPYDIYPRQKDLSPPHNLSLTSSQSPLCSPFKNSLNSQPLLPSVTN